MIPPQNNGQELSNHLGYVDAIGCIKRLEEHGFTARLAGGCVRDRLWGYLPKDYDIATDATPTQIKELFVAARYPVIPTGIDHGTLTVVMPQGPVEITTLRQDIATDGRHATVRFGKSFETDAARRDFTINAMFEDRLGNIYDFFGGMDDLKTKTLRFVGVAKERISEDYLRILRFFRFWARFDLNPDSAALAAIGELSKNLVHISQERITSEIMSILQTNYPMKALEAMEHTGTLLVILNPWIRTPVLQLQPIPDELADYRGIFHLAQLIKAPLNTLAIHKFTKRLRLSNRQRNRLLALRMFDDWTVLELNGDRSTVMSLLDRTEALLRPDAISAIFEMWPVLYPESRDVFLKWHHIERTFGQLRKARVPLSGHDIQKQFPQIKGQKLGILIEDLRSAFRNGQIHDKLSAMDFVKRRVDTGLL